MMFFKNFSHRIPCTRLESGHISIRLFIASSHEEWKEIPGYSNYHASNLGNIRNIARNKIRFINNDNFRIGGRRPQIQLSQDGVLRNFYVSRLILKAFRPIERDHLYQANHIDGNPYNNQLDNLEWVTPSQNMRHAHRIGIGGCSRTAVRLKDLADGTIYDFESLVKCQSFLAERLISYTTMNIILLCRRKATRKGYQFEYADSTLYSDIEDFDNEEWRLLARRNKWEYYISNMGRAKVCYSGHSKLKRLVRHPSGYLRITVCRKIMYAHRAVAQTFIPNPNDLPCVDHIDGNPSNNKVANLRWVTHSENQLNLVTKDRRRKTRAAKES